jgi:hypothetical protein
VDVVSGSVAITVEIDAGKVHSYSDSFLATAWHLAQVNPAPHGDRSAGQLVERLAREIVRRWLSKVEPELWHHQGRDCAQQWLTKFASYTPGDGYHGGYTPEQLAAFEAGHWSVRPEVAAAAVLPDGADVVAAALAWQKAGRPGGDFMARHRAETALTAALDAMAGRPKAATVDGGTVASGTVGVTTAASGIGDGDTARAER